MADAFLVVFLDEYHLEVFEKVVDFKGLVYDDVFQVIVVVGQLVVYDTGWTVFFFENQASYG